MELKTKKDIRKLFGDYVFITANNFLSIVISLITVPFITRLFGSSGYGRYNLFFMLFSIIYVGTIAWSSNATVRFGKEEFLNTGKLNTAFWIRNLIVMPFLGIAIILCIIFGDHIDVYTGIKSVHYYLAVYLIISLFMNNLSSVFSATSRLKLVPLINTVPKILLLVSVLVLFYSQNRRLVYLIISMIIADLLVLTVLLNKTRLNWFYPVKLEMDMIKKIFKFSFPLLFITLFTYIINYIDIAFIRTYLSIESVGIYSLSYKIMMHYRKIMSILVVVLTPVIIGLNVERREDLIKFYVQRIIPQLVFCWSLIVVVSIWLFPRIVPVIFSNEFTGSVFPAQVLIISLIWFSLFSLYSGIFIAYKKTNIMMNISVLMTAINIVGDIFLVPRLGIIGAAVTSLISLSLGGVFSMYFGNKLLKLKTAKASLMIIPVLFSFIAFTYAQIWIFFATAFVYYLILKKGILFKNSDAVVLDHIDMPLKLKGLLKGIYKILSS